MMIFFNTAYVQKINGEAIRHKYRIRYYGNDHHFIKLERKSKIHQMTMKESVPLTKIEVERILANDYAFLLQKEKSLYQEFYLALRHRLLKPKVIVRYIRKAYTHPIGDFRLTFDRDIRTSNMHTNLFDEEAFLCTSYRGTASHCGGKIQSCDARFYTRFSTDGACTSNSCIQIHYGKEI